MHMDLLIENELKEEIYNLILEELTVNNEVLSSSKTVEEEIIEQAKKMNSIVSTNIHSQDEIKRNSFHKYIRNAIHRFEKKFSMVTKKCKNDFFIYESHTWCEGPDFKKYYKIF